jgi:hypothetical protein
MYRTIVAGAVLLVLNGCGDGSSKSNPTTTTTSASITTTSFGDSLPTTTTTTTLGGDVCGCEVTFSVTNSETLGALQYDTSYAGIGGGFDGSGAAVDCTRLAGEFAAFNDIEAETRLSSAIISTTGFTGPIDIARCGYSGAFSSPTPSDFPIVVTDQSRPDFSPADASVTVTDVDCACGGTTTTTSTTLGSGDLYTITYGFDDAITLGALQFVVDYGNAVGGFPGRGYDVSCTSPLAGSGSFASFNDLDSLDRLNVAAISIPGFTGPITVAECAFLTPGVPPQATDFVITVTDASAADFSPVVPFPTVSVSAITPP